MVTKEISMEARTKAAQLGKEIEIKLQLLTDGIKIDDSASEGVGTIYSESYPSIFDLHQQRVPRAIPTPIELPAGTLITVRANANSPFVLKREDGQLIVKKGRRLITQASCLPRPSYYSKRTSDGIGMGRILHTVGRDEFLYVFSTFCGYEKQGGTCHFCNANWTDTENRETRVAPGRKRNQLGEVLAEAVKDSRYAHFTLTSGMIPERAVREGVVADLRTIKEVLGLDRLPLRANLTAPSREVLETLHIEGVLSVLLNLEVWHPDYFRAICPGKDTLPGRDSWIEALKWSVEIFGEGKVASNLVAGLEPMEYTLEGTEYLCSIGVQQVPIVWNPEPGTKFWRHRTPTVDWYLELYEKTADLWFRYGFVTPKHLDPAANSHLCLSCGNISLLPEEINRRKLLEEPDWVYPTAPPLNSLMKN